MYKDMQFKQDYLIEKTIQELARSGVFANRYYAEQKIKDIDLALPLLWHDVVHSGEKLDVEKINEAARLISADLDILFRAIAEEKRDYRELERNVHSYLGYLQELSEQCRKRAIVDLDYSHFGKTIFFQDQVYQKRIDIEGLEARPGSFLTLVYQGAAGELRLATDREDLVLEKEKPVKVPGERSFKKTEIIQTAVPKKVQTEFPILDGADPDREYRILAGYRTYQYHTDGETGLEDLGSDLRVRFEKGGALELYIYGGTYASFEFNFQPANKNFEEERISLDGLSQRIIMEVDPGFELGIDTDAEVFGQLLKGRVKDGKLFCPPTRAQGLLVLEETTEPKALQGTVELEDPEKTDFIAIKEVVPGDTL